MFWNAPSVDFLLLKIILDAVPKRFHASCLPPLGVSQIRKQQRKIITDQMKLEPLLNYVIVLSIGYRNSTELNVCNKQREVLTAKCVKDHAICSFWRTLGNVSYTDTGPLCTYGLFLRRFWNSPCGVFVAIKLMLLQIIQRLCGAICCVLLF